MFVERDRFVKLLQENESRVYWQSDELPSCPIVHVWTHEETGEVILREYHHEGGEVVFWVNEEHFKG